VSVQVVAATNRNLRQEADQAQFRPDLYYPLSVFVVPVPPLRDRRDDIEPLARHFLQFYAAKLRKRLRGMDPAFLQQLRDYDWRGNVRELKNVLERAVILADDEVLTTDTLPPEFQGPPALPEAEDSRSLRAVEQRQIRLVLRETGGNKTEAARQLGIGLKTLYRKIQESGL
jgi:DNA-binding NtrC family response regulator